MPAARRSQINRRNLLKGATLLPLAAVAAPEAGAAPPGFGIPRNRKGMTPVYRLSPCDPNGTRKDHCSCGACVRHAANKFFATSAAADRFRAHTGCNCAIVVEMIDLRIFIGMFRPGTPFARVVYDLRSAGTKRGSGA